MENLSLKQKMTTLNRKYFLKYHSIKQELARIKTN